MILDNADDRTLFYPQHQNPLNDKELQQYIFTYLPQGIDSNGALIITTRYGRLGRELLNGEEPIFIEPLANSNAEHLLQAKVNAGKWNPEAVEPLLTILIRIPLAITQAAAYINRTNDVSVKTYLEMLQKDDSSMAVVLSEDYPDHRRQAGVANAIFKTLRLSYEHIRCSPDQKFKEAADILSLLAIFDSQSVSASLLLGGEITPDERAAIQVLIDFRLISSREDHYSLHSLVQSSIQYWLKSQGDLLRFQERGMLLLAERFPWYEDSVKDRTICSNVISQALHLLPYQSRNQAARADLLHNVGGFEKDHGQYDTALKHAEECRVIRCAVLEEHHEKTLETVYLIGQVLNELGNYSEAGTQFRYVLEHRVKIFGQDHQDTISTLGELANCLSDQGQYEKAETMQRCALGGYLKTVPEDCVHIPISLNNLGHMLQEQGKYDEAGKILRGALKWYENTFGMVSGEGLSTIDNIGVLLSDQGKGVEAEKMHRQGLEGREKVFGRNHPDTLTSITNLAVALDTQRRYVEAEELHREALAGKMAALREKHPDTFSTMSALAWNLNYQGKYEEAISLMRTTKEGDVQVLGADHPYSKKSCVWHTEWLKEVGKHKRKHPNGKRDRNEKSLCYGEKTQVQKRL